VLVTLERLGHPARQFVGLHAPLAEREVGAGAGPERPFPRAGNRDEQGPEWREGFQVREQPERFVDAHRRDVNPLTTHTPSSCASAIPMDPSIFGRRADLPVGVGQYARDMTASSSANVGNPPGTGLARPHRRPQLLGQMLHRSMSSLATMTARSITLRSSRTFPTHAGCGADPGPGRKSR